MVNLDEPVNFQQTDRSGMLAHLKSFPEQCQIAWELVTKFDLPPEYKAIERVIILGMGASAIAGDIISHLARAESKAQVWVNRDYDLPSFANENTLVIASSYSGNTEETISAFSQSLGIKAKKLVITSGGRLKQLAEKEGIPLFLINYKAPPRAAFPHSFIPLLGILQRLGLLRDRSAELEEGIKLLHKLCSRLAETTPLATNPAKQLANKLQGRLIIIYGAEFLSGVAQRWKTQLNENSKTLAFFELFPELNHNAVSGYGLPLEIRSKIFVILLHSTLLNQRNQLRYQATTELLERAKIAHEQLEASGETTLAQILSLILLGDYTSFYLAMLNKVDPTPVEPIEFVKKYLAREEG